MIDHLHFISKEKLEKLYSKRNGETKLGQTVELIQSPEALAETRAPYVLLGVEEDIGIKANLGIPGASKAWKEFLRAFLNLQSNQYLPGAQVAVIGSLRFPGEMRQAEKLQADNERDLSAFRDLTKNIDERVYVTVKELFRLNKTPIIIGGGHNNAYPIIRAYAEHYQRRLSVVNIDPHTDYRQLEGRHSGNGFRYARKEGYLDRYAVFGLHENYNAQDILTEFKEDAGLHYTSFEELLLFTDEERSQQWLNLLHWLGTDAPGLEVDCDSITGFPVSAYNPSGFSLNEVRKYLRMIAQFRKPEYLHLAEASPGRAETTLEKTGIGKALAYLVSDFIKARG